MGNKNMYLSEAKFSLNIFNKFKNKNNDLKKKYILGKMDDYDYECAFRHPSWPEYTRFEECYDKYRDDDDETMFYKCMINKIKQIINELKM